MRSRLLVVPLVLALLALPSLAAADASIVQDFCGVTADGKFLTVEFSIVNYSLPTPICDLHMIPEPLPVLPGCEMIQCTAPGPDPAYPGGSGWACFLNPFGAADWFANTPADCIPAGQGRSGFGFVLDPDFCCYVIQFTGPTGAVIWETEACFCTSPVPVEPMSWSLLKSIYR